MAFSPGLLARLLMRYGIGFLIAVGFLSPDFGGAIQADRDVLQVVEISIGLLGPFVIEGFYYLAKKFGWAT